jgi:ankyrin repeat protein
VKLTILALALTTVALQAQSTSADLLRKAIMTVDLKTMETLLSSGANPNQPDRFGQTPLNLAMIASSQPSAVELLLAAHADANAPLQTRGGSGQSAETPLQYAVQMGNSRLASDLLAAGAGIDAKNSGGRTALHLAVAAANLSMVHFLLDKGAGANVRDNEGAAPLDDAVWIGSVDTAAILLARGAHLNEPDAGTGATPVNEAAFRGHAPLVRYLLTFSPDLETADKRGFTPLDNAIRNSREDCALLLLEAERKDRQTPEFLARTLDGAIRKDEPLLTDTLLHRGLSPNAALPSGGTPLDAAAFNGAAKVVRVLLSNNADPNLTGPNGMAPLSDAALKGFDDVVAMLLDHGAQVNRIDTGLAATALYLAASMGKASTVKTLLDRGANPGLCGGNRRTAYQVALEYGFKEAAAQLLAHGATTPCQP